MNYQALAVTVADLVEQFGQAVSIVQHSAPAYDIETGSTVSTDITFETFGVITDYESEFINNTSILPLDKKLIVPAIGATELSSDASVIINTKRYSVVSLNEMNPAGVVLGYELQIRIA